METDGHNEYNSSPESTEEPIGPSPPPYQDILAPFVKAPAEDVRFPSTQSYILSEIDCASPMGIFKFIAGKKTLGRLIECLQKWFTMPDKSTTVITNITRMLFDASLMLDDIQDGSQLRRGRPAAHAVFGQAQTLNSATYLYVKGSRQLNDLQHSRECREIFLDELETLAFGQGLELHWRFSATLPSIQDYLVMVDNKTGGFFRLVLRLLEVESESEPTPELLHFFTLLGRYYQIRDDYCNLASEEYAAKKGFCEDLSEGKFSFPLIHLLQNTQSPDHIRGVLFNRNDSTDLSVEMKQFVLDELKESGSLEYAKHVLEGLFNAMLEVFDTVEAKLGAKKKLRIFLLMLKL